MSASSLCAASRLPHVRGGVSGEAITSQTPGLSSPRAWGCFWQKPWARSRPRVFPTCVGVFPRSHWRRRSADGLPHVRGGVSNISPYVGDKVLSSPRAWGCFSSRTKSAIELRVFPTCVGVFLTSVLTLGIRYCLPHVRGGVSHTDGTLPRTIWSSPRAWGCFSQS